MASSSLSTSPMTLRPPWGVRWARLVMTLAFSGSKPCASV